MSNNPNNNTFDKQSSYLSQQEKAMTVPSQQFNKTVGAGSMLGGSASRRPEIDHIINPAARGTSSQQDWIQDNLSAFTS